MTSVTAAVTSAAARAVLQLAGSFTRRAQSKRQEHRSERAPSWKEITGQVASQGTAIQVLAREPDARVADALLKFLASAEGKLLARYVAIDEVYDGRSKATDAIIEQARALMALNPDTSELPRQYAAELTAILRGQAVKFYRKVKQANPALASRMFDTAPSEYQSGIFREMQISTNELWDLANRSPVVLAADIASYSTRLAEYTSIISIPSLDSERRVPISSIYVEPALSVEDQRSAASARSADPQSLILSRSRSVILGNPGGGKSTLLRATINRMATKRASGDSGRVPFLIPLAAFSRRRGELADSSILGFLANHLTTLGLADFTKDVLRYLCATGQVVVFFDGLDEVLELADRSDIRDAIEIFAHTYEASTTVVTSRTIGYDEAPLPSVYQRIRIREMDDSRIQKFVHRFFLQGSGAGDDSEQLAQEFLHDSSAVRDLRTNPLMLGLLCLLYEAGRTIPKNLAELYSDCARLLFTQWDSRRGIRIDFAEASTAEDAISAIALRVFLDGQEEVSRDWLEGELVDFYRSEQDDNFGRAIRFAESVIDLWKGRKWLLVLAGVRDGREYYKFSHRTFMEYFAAQRMAFNSVTADGLWGDIRGLVIARAGTVYCLLAVQLHSRHRRGSGDRLGELLIGELSNLDAQERWNLVAFISDALPLLKIQPETKKRLAYSVIEVLSSLVVLKDGLPHEYDLNFDVLALRSDADDRGSAAVVVDPAPKITRSSVEELRASAEFTADGPDLELTFSSAMSPLLSLTRTAGESWPSISDAIQSCIENKVATESSRLRRLQWLRMASELRVFPCLEGWWNLPEYLRERFFDWSDDVWRAATSPDAAVGDLFGMDFWLDLYLIRSRIVSVEEFVGRRGARALLVGRWPYSVLPNGRRSGTALHFLYDDVCLRLARRDASCLPVLETVFDELSGVIRSGKLLIEVGDIVEALDEWDPYNLSRTDLQVLSEKAKGGLVVLVSLLMLIDDGKPLEAIRSADASPLRYLRDIVGVLKYPGEVNEALLAAEEWISDERVRSRTLSMLGLPM
ncbi:NACHT domain-containing protein [Myceligenerans pegani]|uniref:NACHT domain-containing protein n=1 Tax=Myceligenerans pegani TaxID=2776917 RepID=A0ABR9MVR0_9MICO|nr:NACHT domain-containing protein [Myceligenerans sp. TRM 65318]MBE1875480.1 NACHT domain-containing protein [Myceligenerans sp. TRM 65318]MBE3017751.1 NACHT domain-containing protein [Myceligenerans sp. TRM 65318]